MSYLAEADEQKLIILSFTPQFPHCANSPQELKFLS